MSRLRLLFFWLLVLAVPLQGFAATTQLLCGGPGAVLHGRGEASVVAGELSRAQHSRLGDEAAPHTHADEAAVAAPTGEAPAHQCGLCAACCHAVALAATNRLMIAVPLAPAQAPELVTLIPERAPRLPRKPPRT